MKVEREAPLTPETPPILHEGAPHATMDRQYSKFQQKAIKNFYDNRESISLQRLGELVTDLYLAEKKSRASKWKQISAALNRLGVPQSEIDHLVSKDDPALLAKKVAELTGK